MSAIGEEVWNRSGLGSSTDTDDLHQRFTALQEANADLRARIEDLEEEVAAAGSANRELMTRINGRSHARG